MWAYAAARLRALVAELILIGAARGLRVPTNVSLGLSGSWHTRFSQALAGRADQLC